MCPEAVDIDRDDEQYVSSEDSDFAPNDAPEPTSDQSDADDDTAEPSKKSQQTEKGTVDDANYDNSGDEAIIERGKKRRKRARNKDLDVGDDDVGDGGLIKTRSQRAAEKEERRAVPSKGPVTVDVDAIWQQMISGKPPIPNETNDTAEEEIQVDGHVEQPETVRSQEPKKKVAGSGDTAPHMITIKRTYNFAGQVHTEERLVSRDSAEAKLYLASNPATAPTDASPAKRATKSAFRSAFEPLVDLHPQRADLNLGVAARMQAGKEAQAKKLNTVEKSRMDWAGYVDKEGIKDELELASKSKESYTARQGFLARSEARREDEAKRARLAGQA